MLLALVTQVGDLFGDQADAEDDRRGDHQQRGHWREALVQYELLVDIPQQAGHEERAAQRHEHPQRREKHADPQDDHEEARTVDDQIDLAPADTSIHFDRDIAQTVAGSDDCQRQGRRIGEGVRQQIYEALGDLGAY